jgi:hypothetical protein
LSEKSYLDCYFDTLQIKTQTVLTGCRHFARPGAKYYCRLAQIIFFRNCSPADCFIPYPGGSFFCYSRLPAHIATFILQEINLIIVASNHDYLEMFPKATIWCI